LNIGKTARLKDNIAIAQEETIPNIWNGTMFDDLSWPLNASRGFVSISWASCYKRLDDIFFAGSLKMALYFNSGLLTIHS